MVVELIKFLLKELICSLQMVEKKDLPEEHIKLFLDLREIMNLKEL
jgi:hypothetical protein